MLLKGPPELNQISLPSTASGGPEEEVQSSMGTSTALDLQATSDELVCEKVVDLLRGALATVAIMVVKHLTRINPPPGILP